MSGTSSNIPAAPALLRSGVTTRSTSQRQELTDEEKAAARHAHLEEEKQARILVRNRLNIQPTAEVNLSGQISDTLSAGVQAAAIAAERSMFSALIDSRNRLPVGSPQRARNDAVIMTLAENNPSLIDLIPVPTDVTEETGNRGDSGVAPSESFAQMSIDNAPIPAVSSAASLADVLRESQLFHPTSSSATPESIAQTQIQAEQGPVVQSTRSEVPFQGFGVQTPLKPTVSSFNQSSSSSRSGNTFNNYPNPADVNRGSNYGNEFPRFNFNNSASNAAAAAGAGNTFIPASSGPFVSGIDSGAAAVESTEAKQARLLDLQIQTQMMTQANLLAERAESKKKRLDNKDMLITAKVPKFLKESDSYSNYYIWLQSISNQLSTIPAFESIFLDRPSVSWEVFKKQYIKFDVSTQEVDFYQANKNVANWVISQLDYSFQVKINTIMNNNHEQVTDFLNLNLNYLDVNFRRGANTLKNELDKMFSPPTTNLTNMLTIERLNLGNKWYSFKDPLDWYRAYEENMTRCKLSLKDYPKYSESYQVDELLSLCPIQSIRDQVRTHQTIEKRQITLDEFKAILQRYRDDNIKYSSSTDSKKIDLLKQEQKNQSNRSEPANLVAAGSSGKPKKPKRGTGYCYAFADGKPCKSNPCQFKHEIPSAKDNNKQNRRGRRRGKGNQQNNLNNSNNNNSTNSTPNNNSTSTSSIQNDLLPGKAAMIADSKKNNSKEEIIYFGSNTVTPWKQPNGCVNEIINENSISLHNAHVINQNPSNLSQTIQSEISQYDFILDSGSAGNYTGARSILEDIHDDDSVKISTVLGTVALKEAGEVALSDNVTLCNVKFIEGSPYSLASVNQFVDRGCAVVFFKEVSYIVRPAAREAVHNALVGKTLLQFDRVESMFVKRAKNAPPKPPVKIKYTPPRPPSSGQPSNQSAKPAQGPNSQSSQSAPSKNSLRIPKIGSSSGSSAQQSSDSSISNSAIEEEPGEKQLSIENYSHENYYNSLEEIDSPVTSSSSLVGLVYESPAFDLHLKLNHPTKAALENTNSFFKLGINPKSFIPIKDNCEACIKGKPKRKPIGSRILAQTRIALKPMDRWDCDTVGKVNGLIDGERCLTPGLDGEMYCLVMVDNASDYIMAIPVKSKDQIASCIIEQIKLQQNITGLPLKQIHTDGGTEFLTKKLIDFLKQNGTELTVSVPNTPEMNGRAEITNRILFDPARTMLIHSGAPSNLWPSAVVYSAHIRDRLPNKNGKFPIVEMDPTWQHDKILDTFHPYGVDVDVLLDPDKITKTSSRTHPGAFIGRSARYDANIILFKTLTGEFKTKISRDVTFHKTFNFMAENSHRIINQAEKKLSISEKEFEIDSIYAHSVENGITYYLVKWRGFKTPSWEPDKNLGNAKQAIADYKKSALYYGDSQSLSNEVSLMVREFMVNSAMELPDGDYYVPKNHQEAMDHPDFNKWLQAIIEEIEALRANGTFIEIQLPENYKGKLVGSRFVFAIKRNSNGEIVRWKARWVAQGFSQRPGIDYEETFSPTSKIKNLKMILQIAAEQDLELKQMDFDSAFLNAPLHHQIVMKVPPGYTPLLKGNNIGLLLKRALYGLKQASREWNKLLDEFLKTLGFICSPHDESLYVKFVGSRQIFMMVYVDDLLIAYHKSIESDWLDCKSKIANKFKIKDLGDAGTVIGHQIIRDRPNRIITLNQINYTKKILFRFGATNLKSYVTPYLYSDITVGPKENFIIEENNKINHNYYQQIIGSLLYLSNNTRIDIAYITNALARFMHKSFNYHTLAAYRVMAYLGGTINFGLIFKPSDNPLSIEKPFVEYYCDSDHAGESMDRISVTGFTNKINNCIIDWSSHKQKTIAASSTEAELYSVYSAVQDAIYLREWHLFYRKLNINVLIHCDNQSAIEIANHSTNFHRTKHIEVKYLIIRKHLEDGKFKLIYVRTADNLADILTKPLPGVAFKRFTNELLVNCAPDD